MYVCVYVSGKVWLRGVYSVLCLMIADIIHTTNMTQLSLWKIVLYIYRGSTAVFSGITRKMESTLKMVRDQSQSTDDKRKNAELSMCFLQSLDYYLSWLCCRRACSQLEYLRNDSLLNMIQYTVVVDILLL